MRRILSALLFALLAAPCFGQALFRSLNVTAAAGATVSLIQTTDCGNISNGNPCTITGTTAGSGLVIDIIFATVGATVSSITTSGSCSVVQVSSAYQSTTSNGASGIWYCPSAAAGTTTVTINSSAAGSRSVVYEVGSSTGTIVADQANNLANQSASTTPSTPSLTIATASEFFAAALTPGGNCTGIHSGNVFTNDSTLSGFCWAHYVSSATGSYSAQWDTTNGTFGNSIASFKAQ